VVCVRLIHGGDDRKTYNGEFQSAKLVISQPQIFAIIRTLLPRSLNGDRSLKWFEGEPDFGDMMTRAEGEAFAEAAAQT
jgi:hypothetical protein